MTTISAKPNRVTRNWAAPVMFGVCLLAALPAHAGSLAEPATIFYGKIIGTASAQPFLVTEGDLTWTIRRADGVDVPLQTQLRPLNNGEYSYRLNVPHQALSLGLTASADSVPLRTVEDTHTHLNIAVDGLAARIIGPSGATFDAAQVLRASTYRLDLLVPLDAPDSDGNGLPDWWEVRYGLTDPLGDPDGDGLNNRDEFLGATDPTHDDRNPTLTTRDIRAYADGTTMVMLRAVDTDSADKDLTFTLVRPPDEGVLSLRNTTISNTNSDSVLNAGDSFSLDDVNHGRLVFALQNGSALESSASFEVALKDEKTTAAPTTNTVAISVYHPTGDVPLTALEMSAGLPEAVGFQPDEQPFVMSYLLSKQMGYVVCDESAEVRNLDVTVPSSLLTAAQYTNDYVPTYGPDRNHVLLGGAGADRLSGSMEDDVLVGGPGDDILRGNGGADLFVLFNADDGNDTLEDFNVSEGDTLDLSRVLTGSSLFATNYLQLTTAGTNEQLRINCAGNGTASADLIVTLSGPSLASTDLRTLIENGRIVTGNKVFPPRVSIAASMPSASENGPVAGAFELTRAGGSEAPLTVNLRVTGSALNGSDYQYVDSVVTFPAGKRVVSIPITPYVDTLTELTEVVDVAVLAGTGYDLGSTASAQVTIEDLAPQIAIEVLEPVAMKSPLTPGVFLVTRGGIIDRSVFVRLSISGTAANLTDYTGVPTYVNLQAGQTAALIEVTPTSTAVLSNGMEYVQVALKADSTYKIMSSTSANVWLVDAPMSFDQWRQENFPNATGDLTSFASADEGQGIANIVRYAFGLDPNNPKNSSGRPKVAMKDNHLAVFFRRPPAISDIQYLIEVSDDLLTWRDASAEVEEFFPPETLSHPEFQWYRARKAVTEAPGLFMRVRVAYTP